MRNFRLIFPFLIIIVMQVSCVLFEKRVQLEGSSMEPNYYEGQVFQIESISPSDLKRGDIILYSYNDGSNYIKRLVGLPNDTIEIQNGQVYINGGPLDEPYGVVTPSYTMDEKSLRENEYFVLGDNRDNSADSHVLGPVKWDQILGRAIPVD